MKYNFFFKEMNISIVRIINDSTFAARRNGRAVECGGLENR
jgi:hypothetical protein